MSTNANSTHTLPKRGTVCDYRNCSANLKDLPVEPIDWQGLFGVVPQWFCSRKHLELEGVEQLKETIVTDEVFNVSVKM